MKLTKAQREAVRVMFSGHCAYCGNPLGERWHADHVKPVQRKLEFVRKGGTIVGTRTTGESWRPENDRLDNFMPACVPCNIDKHASELEDWRHGLERRLEVLRKNSSAYRHALRFRLIEEKPSKVVFYFESMNAPEQPALAMEARPGIAPNVPCEERAAPLASSLSNEQTTRGGSIARGDESGEAGSTVTDGVQIHYEFVCYSCAHAWEDTTPTSDCPEPGCGTTNSYSAANPNGAQNTDGAQQ